MLPCKTMWNNIIWLMIYQKRSAPNAVSNSFTLQKHPKWWSHPLYPWKTLVERGGLLCRNILGGGHVHSIHEGPWLREVVHATETSQVVVMSILSMRDLGWERCRDVAHTVGAHSYLLPINIYHPWASPHFQVPASRLSPWRLGFL